MQENVVYDNIILFDGVCNLCNGFVRFVLKNERNKVIRFASLQSTIGREIAHDQQIDLDKIDSIIFIKNQKSYIKTKAVLAVLPFLKPPLNILSIFKIIPTVFGDIAYDFIARNRYALFGKRENCWLPTMELKSRFLV